MEVDSQSRKLKGIELAITKPSYNLQKSLNIDDSKSLRWVHKKKLFRSLQKLMWRHDWYEAKGVLSVLLKVTCKDRSPSINRTKYLAALELVKHNGLETSGFKKFWDVFETWMSKSGSPRGWKTKERFLIQLEFILFCLTQGKNEIANQAVTWLLQEREFGYNPISNMIVGLAKCQDWYDKICKEFSALDLNGSNAPQQSVPVPALDILSENPGCCVVDEFTRDNYSLGSNSRTSVGNDKARRCDNGEHHQQVSTKKRRPQSFYVHSDESDVHKEVSFTSHASILCAHGLEPWLLASRLVYAVKSLDEFPALQKKVHNESYKDALKYLRLAINTTPPTPEALFPLVQMLLVGDQVKEAIHEVEKFATHSDTALYLRLRASLLDHFDRHNHVYLSTCFEDALKKDPTCTHSLTRLLFLHKQGDYSADKLLEMVALHLDATNAECNMWEEFASCFLKLSLSREDRISTCFAGNAEKLQGQSNNFKRNPVIVANSVMGKKWIFRCKWWKTRHFCKPILVSEFEAGDMKLLTYKAASACHIYGREFEYVRKVSDCLEKNRNSEMFSFLQKHMHNSVGLYQ